jgi:polysaccharide biosynthesis protein PslG
LSRAPEQRHCLRIGPAFIYTTRDRDTESTVVDDTLGVLRDDFTWKQAAYVIQQWTATHPQEVPDSR